MGRRKHMTMSLMKSLFTKELCMIMNKYSVNPLSALKRFTFFRVSKLTHRGPERQCNPARDRNPAKGKPLLRQGTDGNRSQGGDISLNSLTEAPVVFLAFAVGETASP